MIALSLTAALLPALCCPVTLKPITSPAATLVYAGSTFETCCPKCEAPFTQDPAPYIAKAAKAGKSVGVFAFDPISGLRIEPEKAAASSDYQAIRYLFASKAEKKKFDAAPSKYTASVTQESYHCPVMETDTTFAEAQSYADYKGVRYFMCCTVCVKKFREDPEKYIPKSSSSLKSLSVFAKKDIH